MRVLMNTIQATAVAGFLLGVMPPLAMALVSDGSRQFSFHTPSEKRLLLHPWQAGGMKLHQASPDHFRALNLMESGRTSFSQTVARLLQLEGLHPQIRIKRQEPPKAFGLVQSQQRDHLDFFAGKHRLCEFRVNAHLLSMQSPMISGRMPLVENVQTFTSDAWGPIDHAISYFVKEHARVRERPLPKVVTEIEREACLVVVEGTLQPVWQFIVDLDGLPYLARATAHKVYHEEPRYFHAIGRTRSYLTNSHAGDIIYTTVGNMSGNGQLSSSTFEVSSERDNKVLQCTHEFYFTEDDPAFLQTNAFSNATRIFAWYNETFGFEWGEDNAAMEIKIHKLFDGDSNNAVYIPGDAKVNRKPQIQIGEGANNVLQNLLTDVGVLAHEFGHHVIFRHVTHTKDQSLVLHEGLADFFTFFFEGSPCLGPSICPEGSTACWEVDKCLRTALNEFNYNSQNLPQAAHLRSQLISGMLWDLHKDFDHSLPKIAKVVYGALEMLSTTTSYEEFITSLVAADEEIFGGELCQDILDNASARGFEAIAAGITCTNDESLYKEPEASENDGVGDVLLATSDSEDDLGEFSLTDSCNVISNAKQGKKGSKDWWSCGTVSTQASGPLSYLGTLLALLLPMLFILFRRTNLSRSPR